ncbi:MAG: ABC transporter substrate-binding protein, partial [Actinomyces sp.]|nr:ABC transporter substrate-binding protein [Actinomyces sp.]
MANSLKKVTALGAVASLSMMGLAACSNGDGGESNSASGGQSTAAPAGDGGKVEIAYMHRLPDGDGMVKVQEIADRWNAEHPDIHVTTTKFDGAAHEMIKKLETDIKANSGPCLAMLGYAEVPEMYVKGLVEDVTELADQ